MSIIELSFLVSPFLLFFLLNCISPFWTKLQATNYQIGSCLNVRKTLSGPRISFGSFSFNVVNFANPVHESGETSIDVHVPTVINRFFLQGRIRHNSRHKQMSPHESPQRLNSSKTSGSEFDLTFFRALLQSANRRPRRKQRKKKSRLQ